MQAEAGGGPVPLHVPPSYGQLHTRDVRPGAEAAGEATQQHGWLGGEAAISPSVGGTTATSYE